MPVVSLTRLHQYPLPDNNKPWPLHETHYDGPGTYTAPCPACDHDAPWTHTTLTQPPTCECTCPTS